MKKIAAFFFILMTVALLAGCGREEVPFTARSFEAGEITEVKVEVRDREIRVEASQDETVRIGYYDSEKEFFDISVADGVVTMAAAQDKEWKDYIGANADKEVRVITLALPENLLNNLTLSTTNEDITLPALTVGQNVTLAVNGGNIVFDTLDVGSGVTLDVKNGDITGSILGGWDDFAISCTVKKGDTNLPGSKEGGEKTLTVNANNGDVNIDFA